MGENSKSSSDTGELEWINLRKQTDDIYKVETFGEKLLRKCKENPFVPIGTVATTMCLGLGLWNFRLGNSAKQQVFMRGRILAQGFTVFAFIIGITMNLARSN